MKSEITDMGNPRLTEITSHRQEGGTVTKGILGVQS
jgi:hypothetical protein